MKSMEINFRLFSIRANPFECKTDFSALALNRHLRCSLRPIVGARRRRVATAMEREGTRGTPKSGDGRLVRVLHKKLLPDTMNTVQKSKVDFCNILCYSIGIKKKNVRQLLIFHLDCLF